MPVTPDHKTHMNYSQGSGADGCKSRLHNWYEHGGLRDLLNSPMYMPGIIKESPRYPTVMGIGREVEARANPAYTQGPNGNV